MQLAFAEAEIYHRRDRLGRDALLVSGIDDVDVVTCLLRMWQS
jgi:hypothetical protein